jgi:HNH endonuclease
MNLSPFNCRRCSTSFQRTRKGQCYCEDCRGCAVDGCEKPRGKGIYCDMHYDRVITTGKVGPAHSTLVDTGGPCAVDGCEEIATAAGLCNMHYKRVRRVGTAGDYKRLRARVGSGISVKGYRVLRVAGKEVKEHRAVMERMIGRPLLPNENVHHLDGDKLNNDPSNLELWVKTQPCGQRATDKVKAAIRLLKEYPELVSDEGFRLVALESQEATDLFGAIEYHPAAVYAQFLRSH